MQGNFVKKIEILQSKVKNIQTKIKDLGGGVQGRSI